MKCKIKFGWNSQAHPHIDQSSYFAYDEDDIPNAKRQATLRCKQELKYLVLGTTVDCETIKWLDWKEYESDQPRDDGTQLFVRISEAMYNHEVNPQSVMYAFVYLTVEVEGKNGRFADEVADDAIKETIQEFKEFKKLKENTGVSKETLVGEGTMA